MDDKSIVDLYWARSENAIHETSIKYGKYCYAIAFNILNDSEDAAEMLNDTYMGAWNSMPPNRPAILSTFLGKITRRVSINRWNEQHAQKRGNGEMPLALEELSDAVTASDSISEKIAIQELSASINQFLSTLPETNCQGLFNQIHRKLTKGARSTVWLLTPHLTDYIFPFSRSLQRYA